MSEFTECMQKMESLLLSQKMGSFFYIINLQEKLTTYNYNRDNIICNNIFDKKHI